MEWMERKGEKSVKLDPILLIIVPIKLYVGPVLMAYL